MIAWPVSRRSREDSALVVTSVARSHVGRVRQINEDRVFDCSERRLWAVADGMGGHTGGDLAAQSIVDALRAAADRDGAVVATDMLAAIQAANEVIVRRNEAQGADAGSTVVAACIERNTATIAWAGDSRAYLIRDDATTLITHDHSVVQELIDARLLTAEAAARHPHANVVTRALGVTAAVQIATVVVDVTAGDRLLLCSDGLSRTLDKIDMRVDRDLAGLADRLLADSLSRDGSDNTSFVLVELGR